jgi:hypothetical protein
MGEKIRDAMAAPPWVWALVAGMGMGGGGVQALTGTDSPDVTGDVADVRRDVAAIDDKLGELAEDVAEIRGFLSIEGR